MPIFDDVAKKLNEMLNIAGELTDELIETGKIKYDIFKEDEAIKKIHLEIGKRVYENFKEGLPYPAELDELCRKIILHEESIKNLREKEEEARSKPKQRSEKNEGEKQDTAGVDDIFDATAANTDEQKNI